jgi:hypothetical protein
MKNRKILDKLLELNETVNFIDSQYVKIKRIYNELRDLNIKTEDLEELYLETVICFDKYKKINREFLKKEIDKLKK